jgi:hypothetical protein
MNGTNTERGWVNAGAAGAVGHGSGEPDRRYPTTGLVVLSALSLLLFWVYGHRPLVGLPWQWADDGLYQRQAEGIVRWLHGDATQWLGAYDQTLLTKTPLFAAWLAALYIAGLPLRPAEFALLLAVPWLFRAAVRPFITLSLWQFAAATILLCALPFLPTEQRLLRSSLQVALTSGCQAALIGLILRARCCDAVRTVSWAGLGGLLFALAYLNREESIWLVPMLLSGLAAVLVGSRASRCWRRGAAAAAALVAATVIPITVVSALNYQSYGVFFTTARRAPELTRAHQLLAALEPDTRERYVPIREATRLKAYAVSPSFARLSGYLEGAASDNFARNREHLLTNGRSPLGREFFVTNFQAVLQEAAFVAGARSAPDSEALFAAIASELQSAIAAGRISAGSSGIAMLTAPHPGDVRRIAKRTVVSLRKLFELEGMVFPEQGMSSGSAADLERMANLTHTVLAPTSDMKPVDLPEVWPRVRRMVYDITNKMLIVAYAVTTAALLIFIFIRALRLRREPARVEQAGAGIALFGSLLAFAVGMAMVDVLGFPLLRPPLSPYNNMGFAPLSVLSAFGGVVLIGWQPVVMAWHRTGMGRSPLGSEAPTGIPGV